MESLPYIPGFQAEEPGPLSRFLPPLEEGVAATWLGQHIPPSSWLLDPFGFSPRLPVEAARAGYRVLVTVNNPITHFILEMAANPPSEADFKAALAELASSKRGDEHLEAHLESLYLTRCQQCGREIQAEAFLWRKGEDAPFARVYECPHCNDKGEREAGPEDVERARKIAAADPLHRSRALERVAAVDDEDRANVQEALQNYLPRPLYVLATIINRLESLNLSPERLRALTALVLVACDAGNTLWGYPTERARPKQLITSSQFREQNVWLMLERGLSVWAEAAAPVTCVAWPNKIPGDAGVCVYDGRLRNLAHEVRKEIPIGAVIGSVPRPNQAFWTLSALWAGWLWGRSAVDPYRVALRRRRYDWAWNAGALHSAFTHLFELLGLGTPFFGLLPEVEAPFLTSAFTAINDAGFDLKGMALRSPNDPVQSVWERGERLRRESGEPKLEDVQQTMENYLVERGEPASYLRLHAAALADLTEAHALRKTDQEMDEALRATNAIIEAGLKDEARFIHYSTGEGVDAGLWGLRQPKDGESLTDRAEMAIVTYLQKNPESIYLEIENDLYQQIRGLLTPSKGMIYEILNSYASKDGANWRLREEDTAARRQQDLNTISGIIQATGKRLKYGTRQQDKWLIWEQDGETRFAFIVIASALLARAIADNPHSAAHSILVIPGGRAGLIAYKAQRDPVLAEKMIGYRLAKYRLWRSLAEASILTRETFEEQLLGDPIERASGQMIMF